MICGCDEARFASFVHHERREVPEVSLASAHTTHPSTKRRGFFCTRQRAMLEGLSVWDVFDAIP
jgi:hypothetical protein